MAAVQGKEITASFRDIVKKVDNIGSKSTNGSAKARKGWCRRSTLRSVLPKQRL
jgi:hypothetical protein